MSFKKKFKRFRKEWFYTGSLAFLTACFIMLILFTSFIISNAASNSDNSNSDIIDRDVITDYLDSQSIDFADYQTCIGSGFQSGRDSIFNNFDYSVLDSGSNDNLEMYVRDVDNEFDVTSYHAIFNINVTHDLLTGLPYIIQYDSQHSQYIIRFFCSAGYDSSYNWDGTLNPVNVSCVNRCVFVPANSMVINYYINSDGSYDDVGSASITYDNSGYSTTWENNGNYYNVTYMFLPNYPSIMSNFDISGLLDTYSDVYYSSFGSDDKSFYLSHGITPDDVNIVKMHPILGSGDDQDGDDSNYLVMNNGDWTFQNSQYSAPYSNTINTGNVYPNGKATFSFDLDDYQLQNTSNFEVVYKFEFVLDVNYQNWGSNDLGPFKQTSKLLNTKKNYKARFLYDFNDSPALIENLQSFYNSGCSHSFNFKDLFDNLHSGNKTLSGLLSQMKELDSVSYNSFDLYCTAFLDSQNTTNSSGFITEWYNPMSKKGLTTDSSGKTNPNPYIPSDEDQGEDDVDPTTPTTPGPGGNDPDNPDPDVTTTSGNGSVNVTVTNNPTFNNNVNSNSSSSGGGTSATNPENASVFNFYNTFSPFKFIFGKLAGDNTSDVSDVEEVTGVNPWIQLMSTTFGFLPESFWTLLVGMFAACVGIIVVAFILRVILDLL